jgi:hypothetical protein
MRHPMQPLVRDGEGTIRFKANEIVRYLLDNGKIDMNDLAEQNFSQDDRTQFAQLIGYSVDGFHELSYVSDEDALAASKKAWEDGLGKAGCRAEPGGCEIHSGVSAY